MRFGIVTLFPELLAPFADEGILGKARRDGLVTMRFADPREWATDRHRKVDDYVYGGGAGMLLKPDVLGRCLADVKKRGDRVVALAPAGRPFDRALAAEYAALPGLVLLCGRYEGFDERFLERHVDERVSLGDFVAMGGEAAAMLLVEAVARRLPGVLGKAESFAADSFEDGLLEGAQYTRPPEWEGRAAPEALLNGNHAAIGRWRRRSSLRATCRWRPDLLLGAPLGPQDERDLKLIYKELYCGRDHQVD